MRKIKVLKLNEINDYLNYFQTTVKNKYRGSHKMQDILDQGKHACTSLSPILYSEEFPCKKTAKSSIIAAYIDEGVNQVEVYGLARVTTHKNGEEISLYLEHLGAFDGAGKELFQYILRTAYQNEFGSVYWTVASSNDELKNFYRDASKTNNNDYHGTLDINNVPATFTFLRQ